MDLGRFAPGRLRFWTGFRSVPVNGLSDSSIEPLRTESINNGFDRVVAANFGLEFVKRSSSGPWIGSGVPLAGASLGKAVFVSQVTSKPACPDESERSGSGSIRKPWRGQ